ncbi:hypothetical protein SRHO_G00256100 [Serrasalmus rhombeus]
MNMKKMEDQCQRKDTTQLKPENSGHAFRFRYQFNKYEVTCDASMTVLERLHRPISAVFDFEDLDMGNKLSLKENLVAYFYGKNDKGQHLDFALLELSDDAELPYCPELFSRYSPPPTRGGICIVGHPDGGSREWTPVSSMKKMKFQMQQTSTWLRTATSCTS